MNNRTIGTEFEELAIQYLENNGVSIIERNYRIKTGEIDIIGKDGKYLVFFEIKSRQSNKCGYSESAVGFQKQKQICKVADFYRIRNKIMPSTPQRYDAIAFNGDKIHWIKNAFQHIYR